MTLHKHSSGRKIMGCWSYPNTEEKANQLKQLMEKPFLREGATDQLYELMGDDILFDTIDSFEEGSDIRGLVIDKLEKWLEELDIFTKPWDIKAVDICQEILNNA